jgi:hypothetical protein
MSSSLSSERPPPSARVARLCSLMSPAHAEPGPPNHVLLSVLVLRAASPAQGEDLEVRIIRGEDSHEAGVVLRAVWHAHKIYF